jgi:hypothetical protein
VIPRVRVTDRDNDARYDLQLEIQRRPNAVFFKRPARTNVVARVCVACGHVDLYAEAPGILHAAYLQAETGGAEFAMEELERTREALLDAHSRLHDLEEKLAFVESLLGGLTPGALPNPAADTSHSAEQPSA